MYLSLEMKLRLEPILARIGEDHKVVVLPAIDRISEESISYQNIAAESIGGFLWELQFSWHYIPETEKLQRKSPADPIRLFRVLWKHVLIELAHNKCSFISLLLLLFYTHVHSAWCRGMLTLWFDIQFTMFVMTNIFALSAFAYSCNVLASICFNTPSPYI